jgi:hypothetical protein
MGFCMSLKDHGGALPVGSEDGKRTRFLMDLPADDK